MPVARCRDEGAPCYGFVKCVARMARDRSGSRTGWMIAAWLLLLSAPLVADSSCPGDCDADGRVTVGELVLGIDIVLAKAGADACPALDAESGIGVSALMSAVNSALYGCPVAELCESGKNGSDRSDSEIRRAVSGSNGTYTDHCDGDGNLVEYACESIGRECWDVEESARPPAGAPRPPAPCGPRQTGDVTRHTVDCSGHCRNGSCAGRCPNFGDPILPVRHQMSAIRFTAVSSTLLVIAATAAHAVGNPAFTRTPTPTGTCTPGANPAPGCAYEGPPFTYTATRTCTPGSNPAPGCAYEGPTFTSTPTRTCTPGSNPAPGCGYEGPTFTMTPVRTPTPECGNVCDGRRCGTDPLPCPGGYAGAGFCMTTEKGCECIPECPSPAWTSTSTATPTRPGKTPGPSTTPARAPCAGDCNGNGAVTIDELVRGVAITLGKLPIDVCTAFAQDRVGVDALVRGVRYSLRGCPPSGWCFVGPCDQPGGFPMTKDLCCWYGRKSQQPQPVYWCSELDSTTGTCATQCAEPCVGCTVNGRSFMDLDCGIK